MNEIYDELTKKGYIASVAGDLKELSPVCEQHGYRSACQSNQSDLDIHF